MYKKSYAGFVLSISTFVALMMLIPFIPGADDQQAMRLVMLLMVWYMAALAFHIWLTEQIYWYNGTSYGEAEAAGSERRKAFAWRHFRIFGLFALIQTVLTCAIYLLGWSAWIDFTVAMIGLVAACCMTVPIKL